MQQDISLMESLVPWIPCCYGRAICARCVGCPNGGLDPNVPRKRKSAHPATQVHRYADDTPNIKCPNACWKIRGSLCTRTGDALVFRVGRRGSLCSNPSFLLHPRRLRLLAAHSIDLLYTAGCGSVDWCVFINLDSRRAPPLLTGWGCRCARTA